MVECPFCNGDASREAMDAEKQKRLQQDVEALQGTDLAEIHCENCGHTWYVKEHAVEDLQP